MPRSPRLAPGGYFYHVLNRSNGRARIFAKPSDYDAFEDVMIEALDEYPTRILAYCVMPNHWHLVLWPREDGELPQYMQWLTMTHTQRWHAHRKSAGTGHLYQGRYKAFPVQPGLSLYRVLRYVERNPLRAGLVDRAEKWRWGSLWRRQQADPELSAWLQRWPSGEPEDWLRRVNGHAETDEELRAIRECASRGAPLGSDIWRTQTAETLGLTSTLRPRGRPRTR
jgi:putative transposase